YHIREAGSTALQELAFTIYDGVEYVEWARRRGLNVDEFGPRLSFFFNSHNDFFEEIAKFRASRKIWYRLMKDRFGAQSERTRLMRFHTQTAGVSLTAQQPLNNIVRTTIEALAGVLGGTQSLHTNSYDEALALPTEDAARIALRTQQIIAYETGVTSTADPLGGSYFVEALTDHMEAKAYEYFAEIDEGRRTVVGVNRFTEGDDDATPYLKIDPALERKQIARVQEVRARRDSQAVEQALDAVREAAASDGANLMEPLLRAARAEATEGELVESLQRVFGRYTEAP